MKTFEPTPWVVPQSVLITGTYNKEGVSNAFSDGKDMVKVFK